MANHKSAVKRARQAIKRRDRNRAIRSAVRTEVKSLRKAIDGGDAGAARTQLQVVEGKLRRAASKGVYKKTTASRSVSRLAKAVAALQG